MPLLRIPLDGGEEAQVLDGIVERAWAVDSNGVWFERADKPDHGELCFFDFKTGKTTTALTITRPMQSGMVLSPDGRRVFWNQLDSQNSEILLVENFR